jgi:hypothetical protein
VPLHVRTALIWLCCINWGSVKRKGSQIASRMSIFKRRRVPVEIILLCVRWYCKYSISYRNLTEMMSERGSRSIHPRSFAGFNATSRRSRTFNYPHFGLSGSACLTGTNRDSVVGTSSSVRGVPWIGFRLGFPVILPIPACRACAGRSPIRQGKAARELGHHEGAPPCHPSRRGG